MILQILLQFHTTSNQVICRILPSSHTHHRPQSYSRSSWKRWSYYGNTSHYWKCFIETCNTILELGYLLRKSLWVNIWNLTMLWGFSKNATY